MDEPMSDEDRKVRDEKTARKDTRRHLAEALVRAGQTLTPEKLAHGEVYKTALVHARQILDAMVAMEREDGSA